MGIADLSLTATLAMLAEAAEGSADPWWIIGSAAVALHGGAVGRVRDVDLMMSAADAARLLERVGVEPQRGSGDALFRSAVFGVWRSPPVPVDAFGGFELCSEGAWRAVTLATRDAVTLGGATVFVPAREELGRLLRSFGRAKDLERAAMIEGLG